MEGYLYFSFFNIIMVEKTLNPLKANIIGGVLIILITIPIVELYIYLSPTQFNINFIKNLNNVFYPLGYMLIIGIFVFLVVFHEIIHAIVAMFFCKKGYKSVKINIHKKTFTPYMHCKEPLKKLPFILVTITPLIFLGIIPLVFAFIYYNHIVFSLGLIMTVAAIGDIIILYYIIPISNNKKIQDHPKKVGFCIYD